MISNTIPPIAVQIIVRAINIHEPGSDAIAYFKLLQNHLQHMTIRKIQESREQVLFTAALQDRKITILLFCAPIEEDPFIREDTLYLNFGGTRLDWDYAAGTR